MRAKQATCKICKRIRTGSHINGRRICLGCQPQWKEGIAERKKALKKREAIYWGLVEQGLTECGFCGSRPQRRRLSVLYSPTGEGINLICFQCSQIMGRYKSDPRRYHVIGEYLERLRRERDNA